MFVVMTGGSGSGKSQLAEQLAVKLWGQQGELFYLATMENHGKEAEERILRHQAQRRGKGFTTLECPLDLQKVRLPQGCTVLVECLSNLVANEMFERKPTGAKGRILQGMEQLQSHCRHLVVVTNEVFSDGERYPAETQVYLKTLGELNCALSQEAQVVVEGVCGIPLVQKGKEWLDDGCFAGVCYRL